MLMQSFTHKSNKITTSTTDSYKQLFVLITMLLTVLSIQPSTFTMAAPLDQLQPITQQQHNLLYNSLHHSQLHERHRYHNNNYNHHPLHHLQHGHHQQQLETDSTSNEERLHKREISWHDYYNSIMQSQAINWYNPCGGILNMDQISLKRKRPPPIKKELKKLQNTIAKNYNLIKNTLHAINIRKMSQWKYIGKKYSFLPKLNTNSSISLRRWHRQLQIYVAAFEYLRRAQLHFDNLKSSQESGVAHELNELMKDARVILCNIEHAINNTRTRKGASIIDAIFLNRTKMENILNFTTNIKYVSPLKWSQIKDEKTVYLVDLIDLKFAKSHFYDFLRKLMKTLRMHTKRSGPIYLGKRAKTKQQQKIPKNRHIIKIKNSKKKL